MEKELDLLKDKLILRDQHCANLEQENAKMREELKITKGTKLNYDSFVSGLSAPKLNKTEFKLSTAVPVAKKEDPIIEQQQKIEIEALQKLQPRTLSRVSQPSTEQVTQNQTPNIQSRRDSASNIENKYKSLVNLAQSSKIVDNK